MDKTMQVAEELRDEELYALLDKAMADERLCVSEDLIQKTLQRVKEENNAEVIPFEKKTAKKYRFMKYAGAAVAAVFVLVLGVKVIGGQKFTADDVQMEATQDSGARKSETSMTNGIGRTDAVADSATDGDGWFADAVDSLTEFYYSSAGGDNSANDADDMEEAPTQSRGTDYMGPSTITMSSELRNALNDAGYTPVAKTAEYWEYVQLANDWEEALCATLVQQKSVESESEFPKTGAYQYALTCADGTSKQIGSEEPLEFIVRIETEQGMLWCFFGENVHIYTE